MKTLIRRLPDTDPFRRLSSCRGFFVPAAYNRNYKLWLLIAVLSVLLASPVSTEAQDTRGIQVSAERLALVVGNNAYHTAPLRNPENDAEDMGAVLSNLGFNVTLKKNVDRRGLEDAIRQFGRQLRHGGVGLFYFAGHGLQVGGRNYLIPINARIESESDVSYEAVDAGFALGKMEDAQNQLNIVILDACRSNPYARSFRSENMGLARMDAPTGSLIVYATAPGDVAADGPERNGVFTKHLIRHMQTPNLPVEQVLKRVRIDVAAETKQRQIPWESSSLMGDFYFKTQRQTASKESPPLIKPSEGSNQDSSQMTKIDGPERTNINGKNKLAIFPVNFSDGMSDNFNKSSYYQIEKSTIAYLSNLSNQIDNFEAVYNYYDLSKDIPNKKIDPSIIGENEINYLWATKSFFDKYKTLNIDLAIKLAKELKVDHVFTCDGRIHSTEMFLIDVSMKKVYLKSCVYSVHAGYSKAPKCLNDFFTNYKNYLVK